MSSGSDQNRGVNPDGSIPLSNGGNIDPIVRAMQLLNGSPQVAAPKCKLPPPKKDKD